VPKRDTQQYRQVNRATEHMKPNTIMHNYFLALFEHLYVREFALLLLQPYTYLGRLPLTSVKHRPSVVFLFNGLHWPYPRDCEPGVSERQHSPVQRGQTCRYQFVDEADELMVVGTANTLRTNAHALLVLRQRDAIL
jgi:hypothetical protein